jgi:hypothetical protein
MLKVSGVIPVCLTKAGNGSPEPPTVGKKQKIPNHPVDRLYNMTDLEKFPGPNAGYRVGLYETYFAEAVVPYVEHLAHRLSL